MQAIREISCPSLNNVSRNSPQPPQGRQWRRWNRRVEAIQQVSLVVVHNNCLGCSYAKQHTFLCAACRNSTPATPWVHPWGTRIRQASCTQLQDHRVWTSRDLGLIHDIFALPHTCKRKAPEIAVHDVLEAFAQHRHFLCSDEIRFAPVIIRVSNLSNQSNLSNLSNLSMLSTYTRTLRSTRKSASLSDLGGNFGNNCPSVFSATIVPATRYLDYLYCLDYLVHLEYLECL